MKPPKKPFRKPKYGEHTGHPVPKEDLNQDRIRAYEKAVEEAKRNKKR